MEGERTYTDFDYEHLTELYSKNDWLRFETNHLGLEDLWFDYKTKTEKLIIKNLINNFSYLSQEDAEILVKNKLLDCIRRWNLEPNNTLFIGFREHKYPDGCSILLNFFKAIMISIDDKWKEYNFLPDFDYGMLRIKKGGFKNWGLSLKKVVIVDDFVGTGGSAIKKISKMKQLIHKEKSHIDLKMFALASMLGGKMKIARNTNVEFSSTIILKKGTTIGYEIGERNQKRKYLKKMESILFGGNKGLLLKDHSLGYGKSESLYAWNRFNIPNNNYPIFWWHRYFDGSKRKALFNRNQ